MDLQPYNGMIFSNKKQWALKDWNWKWAITTDTHKDMDKFKIMLISEKGSVKRLHTVRFHLYDSLKRQNCKDTTHANDFRELGREPLGMWNRVFF